MDNWMCEKAENCFINARTYVYFFPFSITEEILEKEKGWGELRIKKNFRRPCYFFDLNNGIRIKGILNDDQAKVSFPEEDWEAAKAGFEEGLTDFLQKGQKKDDRNNIGPD